jgi:hypothetical protein
VAAAAITDQNHHACQVGRVFIDLCRIARRMTALEAGRVPALLFGISAVMCELQGTDSLDEEIALPKQVR